MKREYPERRLYCDYCGVKIEGRPWVANTASYDTDDDFLYCSEKHKMLDL